MNTALYDAVSDYCSSESILFISPVLKPRAEELLVGWCRLAGDTVTIQSLTRTLVEMASPDLSHEIRSALPELLGGFFSYLKSTGRFPAAREWEEWIPYVAKEYSTRLRDDGSVRGETFRKNYTDVGRNDPCPCGSGKKFKKCCRGLIT